MKKNQVRNKESRVTAHSDNFKITEDVCNTIYNFISSGLKKSECVLVHGISNGSVIYLVAGIYLMMRFKWTVNKAIEYLCVKQPCFYIAPHFHKALYFLEGIIKSKNSCEISGTWDLTREMKKQEQIITHTFINTRIASEPPQRENIDLEIKSKIESNIPSSNRNQKPRINSFSENDGNKRRIQWMDQGKDRLPLAQVIVNKHHGYGKKDKSLPKIRCHREEFKLAPIIKRCETKPKKNVLNITTTTKNDENEPLLTNLNNSKRKINESLDHIPSAKLYDEEENKESEDEPGKRKRIKSARAKDSKAKSTSKSKKTEKNFEKSYGAPSNKISKDGKTMVRKHRTPYDNPGVGNGFIYSSKVTNNFFNLEQKSNNEINDPSSIELEDILNKGGVSDINFKKQMLINKIRSNEIDHDKYMKVIKAISDKSNEPDQESSIVMKKGYKAKQGPVAIQNQGIMPVVNFNFPPPVINTLIVNGNNNIFNFGDKKDNQQDKRISKGAKEGTSTSKEILGSNSVSNKVISKNPKAKVIADLNSNKRSKLLNPNRKDKVRSSYGANSETREAKNQFKQFDSSGVKENKIKGTIGDNLQNKNGSKYHKNQEDIMISGISPSNRASSKPKSNKDKAKVSKKSKV